MDRIRYVYNEDNPINFPKLENKNFNVDVLEFQCNFNVIFTMNFEKL